MDSAFFELVKTVGLPVGILIVIIYSGSKGVWVFAYYCKDIITELREQNAVLREENKELKGMVYSLAGLAEKSIISGNELVTIAKREKPG